MSISLSFELPPTFVATYRARPSQFGFNGLGAFVFARTYSRDDNPRLPFNATTQGGHLGESWVDVCQRVIEGMFSIQKDMETLSTRWDEQKGQAAAKEAFDLMFNLKWSPPGRGMWMMGTPFIHDRRTPEALLNCGFISTRFLKEEGGDQFAWVMNMLMLGVGIGFDVFGAGTQKLYSNDPTRSITHVVEDSREGWADAIRVKYNSYTTPNHPRVKIDTHKVRPYGSSILGFGGKASGPAPLLDLFYDVEDILDHRSSLGAAITVTDIVDIFNMIGRCVIAGNVRRSAEIAIGPSSDEFLGLKNPEINSKRMASHGWASNNTVMIEEADDDYDYKAVAGSMLENGEPGVFWLGNARKFARMNGVQALNPDSTVLGTNPCFTGDTKVWTADGPRRFDEIVGMEPMVLTETDDGKLTFRRMSNVGITRHNAPVYRVIMNYYKKGKPAGRSSFRATGDHVVFLRDRSEIRVSDLTPGDRLASTYARRSNDINNTLLRNIVEIDNSAIYEERQVTLVNHEVISVEFDGYEDVYDGTVDETHKFYIVTEEGPDQGGVLVHNCGEQMLGHRELCTLVELYLPRMESKTEFLRSIKYAYLYGKAVTLLNEEITDPISREIMVRNHRVGLSTTGYAQILAQRGIDTLIEWLSDGYDLVQRYDEIYSDWFGVGRSIRTTSIKPSGSVSLVAGVTPGVHYPISRFYKRRVQVSSDSPQVELAQRAGYQVEPDALGRPVSHIVFPVDAGKGVRSSGDVPINEQVELAAIAARYWADNNPSFTGMINPEVDTVESLSELLSRAQHQFKAISILPLTPEGAYEQMPYETIDETTFSWLSMNVQPELLYQASHEVDEEFCSTEECEISFDLNERKELVNAV